MAGRVTGAEATDSATGSHETFRRATISSPPRRVQEIMRSFDVAPPTNVWRCPTAWSTGTSSTVGLLLRP